jgi:sialidase-1
MLFRSILSTLAAALLLPAAPPFLQKSDLWQADSSYAQYRIPGIVVTRHGVALAYCEARRSANDWAAIDIVLRRSVDGGKSTAPLLPRRTAPLTSSLVQAIYSLE